jgi:hypothetical protein
MDGELMRIGDWNLYRKDWQVNRNLFSKRDGVEEYYGRLIDQLFNNEIFKCEFTQKGGMSNYLEFVCYYKQGLNIDAIILFVNLCAPIWAYGQIKFSISKLLQLPGS